MIDELDIIAVAEAVPTSLPTDLTRPRRWLNNER